MPFLHFAFVSFAFFFPEEKTEKKGRSRGGNGENARASKNETENLEFENFFALGRRNGGEGGGGRAERAFPLPWKFSRFMNFNVEVGKLMAASLLRMLKHVGRAIGKLFMPCTQFNWVVTQFSTLAVANEYEKNSSHAGRVFFSR